jgi:DNA-directed RNA polymerase sigma subunit (sigma70/sigma32)
LATCFLTATAINPSQGAHKTCSADGLKKLLKTLSYRERENILKLRYGLAMV